jgi:arsenite transporter
MSARCDIIARHAVGAQMSAFGFESGVALATVAGLLTEAPVMLLVVKVANVSGDWIEKT